MTWNQNDPVAPKVLGILQARVSSSRLPGKVLKPILGRPMLELHLERLAYCRRIDRIVVATSTETGDDPIGSLCQSIGVDFFRGSLTDVLDRFYQTARGYQPDIIVRLTGDCPLADPQLIDAGIDYFLEHDFDYLSNCDPRTYPIGLDFEIFSMGALETAWVEATLPSEREHVTPYLQNHPDRFSIGCMIQENNLSHHRWTVDEPADFEFVTQVYQTLYPQNPHFTTEDILALLEQYPELTRINYHIIHGAGYLKSLDEDARFRAGRLRE
jgi:spore coat polysaccharide biosynthesis protein SpsF (cytidylyltransferase family)